MKTLSVDVGHLLRVWNNNIVVKTSKIFRMSPKEFSYLTFNAVPLDGRPSGLESDTYPIVIEVIWDTKYNAFRKTKDVTLIKETPVLPRIVESSGRIKCL